MQRRNASFVIVSAMVLLFAAPMLAEINLLSYGADPTGVANSGPALQQAINALGTGQNGTSLYVPPGTYLLQTGVTRNFSFSPSSIMIRGEGSASIFKIALGATGRAMQLQNINAVLLDNLTFAGSTTNGSAVDAMYTLDFEYCWLAVVRRCEFYGVTTVRNGSVGTPAGAVVYAYHTNLSIEHCQFRACAGDFRMGITPFDGTPVVDNDQWTGLNVTDTEFIDWGTLNGVSYYGATYPPSSAWIRLRTPLPRTNANGNSGSAAAGQGEVIIRRVTLDEGAYYGIAMRPTAGTPTPEAVSHVLLSGIMVNGFYGSLTDMGSGVYINSADRVTVEKSWFGWTTAALKPAIELTNVASAVIDGVLCDLTRTMTKFKVGGTTNLTIRNSVYSQIDGTPAVLNIETNQQSALSIPIRTLSAATTLDLQQDQVVVVTQPVTITLPSVIASLGRSFTIKNESPAGTTAVTVADGSSIDGTSVKYLSTHSCMTVVSSGTGWYIVSQTGTVQ